MRRAEVAGGVAGALLLAGSAGLVLHGQQQVQARNLVIETRDCRTPLTVLGSSSAPAVILFHGLSSNRGVMMQLGRWLESMRLRIFLVDSPGHGNNTAPFRYVEAEECAAALLETLEQRGEIQPERTVLMGHSMGGGIAVRLADRFPAAATVAVSTGMRVPPPALPGPILQLEFPRRMPPNLLLLTAEYDLPGQEDVARKLLRAAGGERYQAEDFGQRRAVRWVQVPGTTHTSLVFAQIPEMEGWLSRAVGATSPSYSLKRAALFVVAGAAGLLLLFRLAASLVAGAIVGTMTGPERRVCGGWVTLAAWAVASLAAVAVQFAYVPLAPVVRIYSGDHLASCLFIAGIGLLVWFRRGAQQARRGGPLRRMVEWRVMAAAAVLGMAAILAFGAWLNWQVTDAWLNEPRWWRFAALLPLLWPYFRAEETALGSPRPLHTAPGTEARGMNPASKEVGYGKMHALRRFVLFLGLRLVIWLAMLMGVLLLRSGEVLPLLLAVYLAVFSILQRLGMDAVRRRTGSAAAAAAFGAILGAWFIAAVFPIA